MKKEIIIPHVKHRKSTLRIQLEDPLDKLSNKPSEDQSPNSPLKSQFNITVVTSPRKNLKETSLTPPSREMPLEREASHQSLSNSKFKKLDQCKELSKDPFNNSNTSPNLHQFNSKS